MPKLSHAAKILQIVLFLTVTLSGSFFAEPARAQIPVTDGVAATLLAAILADLQQVISGGDDEISQSVKIAFQGQTNVSQGNANAQNQNALLTASVQNAGLIASEGVMSKMSTLGIMPMAMQTKLAMHEAAMGAVNGMVRMGLDKGTGKNQQGDGAGNVADACGINGTNFSFINADAHGQAAASSVNCANGSGSNAEPGANPYANMDLFPSTVTDNLMLSLPGNLAESPDHHIIFDNVVAVPGQPTQDPALFVAAIKVCEVMQGDFKAPYYPQAMTMAQLATFEPQRRAMAFAQSAAHTCFEELAYRLACPKSSESALKQVTGPGVSCYQTQVNACHALYDDIAQSGPKGLGIKAIGSSDADVALANCDTFGFSEAMFDKVMTHRCLNNNWVAHLPSITGGNMAEAEKMEDTCAAEDHAFNDDMERRRANLEAAFRESQHLTKL